MSNLACHCGTRLKRPDDASILRAACPACGAVIEFDALPTLEYDEPAPEFTAVSLELGHAKSRGGAWVGISIRIDDRGKAVVYVNASETGRKFETLSFSLEEFDDLARLVQKTSGAISRLHAPGRVRAIFRGTRDG